MQNNNFSVFLSFSFALHLILIYFFLFGLPSFFQKLPEEQVLTFEILPISDISNVLTQKKQVEKPIENEDTKKIERSIAKKEAEQKTIKEKPAPVPKIAPEKQAEEKPKPKQPVVPEKQVEGRPPVADKIPDVIPEKPVIQEKIEPEKVVEKEKPKEEQKPTEQKIEEKKTTEKKVENKKKEPVKTPAKHDDLDSLLKNLEQSSEGANIKSSKISKPKQPSASKESRGKFNDNLPLSISEMALIKQQIEKHWNNIPPGARNNDKIKIILYIAMDIKGNIEKVELKEKICPDISASICQALSDTAMRAVWQATPIEHLNPSRYSVWKEINFVFDPSKL